MDVLPGPQPPKSRTSAKEAVSSRWASRAEQSVRATTVRQQRLNQQQQQGQVSSKTASASSSSSSALSSSSSLSSTNHHAHPPPKKKPQQASSANPNFPTPSPLNQICRTWKQVQNLLGGQLLKHLAQEQQHYKPKRRQQQQPRAIIAHQRSSSGKAKKEVPKPSPRALKAHKDQLTNTLTNMRVSMALQNQLTEITNGESKKYLKSVLSVLPAGFDESSALTSSIQTRKRAFLLMDLGRVIRAHAQFLAQTCGFGDVTVTVKHPQQQAADLPPTHQLRRRRGMANNVGRKRRGVYIQPQFKVMKNPSSELLKLLTRLGVDLRCNSSDDVLAASQAIREERDERDGETHEDAMMVLVDDVSKSRKPNGYIRRLLQSSNSLSHPVDIAVDGVDEVHRISDTAKQIARRHGCDRSHVEVEGFRIILRLPTGKMEHGIWERLILNVYTAAVEVGCDLVGVSVNLSPWSDSLGLDDNNKNEEEASERILLEICNHLRIFRLLMLSVGQNHIRIDLTGLPYPLSRDHSEKLTDMLKYMICSSVSREELVQLRVNVVVVSDKDENKDEEEESKIITEKMQTIAELANDPSTSSVVFTADVSDHLVARAGALCTRIIGVKNGKDPFPTDMVDDANPSEDQPAPVVAVAVKKSSSGSSKHYYIDDGCYGSLGKCSSSTGGTDQSCSSARPVKEHVPLPLYGGKLAPKKTSHCILKSKKKSDPTVVNDAEAEAEAGQTNNNNNTNVKSTVWGPTCDGLDKVCDGIMLPGDLQANRDWLVFSNLGCGGFGGGLGLGTAFNGFDPPDVAYCVLGYFAHLVEQQ